MLMHRSSMLSDESGLGMLVAHACNPSYSGGRVQEDRGWRSGWANSLRSYLEKNNHKKGWWSGLRYRSWVQIPVPHPHKKKSRFIRSCQGLHKRMHLFLCKISSPQAVMGTDRHGVELLTRPEGGQQDPLGNSVSGSGDLQRGRES
jgi:hypothetical protein